MGQIKVYRPEIEGLCVIEPAVHGDERGYFMETYNQKDMHEAELYGMLGYGKLFFGDKKGASEMFARSVEIFPSSKIRFELELLG